MTVSPSCRKRFAPTPIDRPDAGFLRRKKYERLSAQPSPKSLRPACKRAESPGDASQTYQLDVLAPVIENDVQVRLPNPTAIVGIRARIRNFSVAPAPLIQHDVKVRLSDPSIPVEVTV